jgi:hypothetical protein
MSKKNQPQFLGAAVMRACLCLLLVLVLGACGNYDGEGDNESALLSGGSPSGTSGSASANAAITPTSAISIAAFEQTVFPMLRDNCAECHSGAGPGSPSFAHFDSPTAHFAIMQNQKVYLGNPINSRIVQRVAVDLHYCWGVCTENAEALRAEIAAWATLIDYDGGGTDVAAIRSQSQLLADGREIDPGDDRYTDNAIAVYEFKEGAGDTAFDTSGVLPALDLSVDEMHFMTSWGIENVPGENGMAIGSREDSRKLYDLIADPTTGSQQYTIEAWIVAANISQEGPARVVSYSNGTGQRNFTMGQVQYNYDFRNRNISPESSDNGQPTLQTYDDDRDLQATLQHAVLTYDQYRGRTIYVNGVFTDDLDDIPGAQLWTWDPTMRLVLGNETSRNRLWLGKLRYLAIHRQALTEAEIQQNYRAGVGRRIVVQFDVSEWAGPGALIEAIVSEIDDYSYLVCEPTFLGADQNGVRVKNVRVAINGIVPVAGQAFSALDVGIFEPRQLISGGCTVVAKDQGPAADVFSLEFEYLGSFQNVVNFVLPPTVPDLSVNAAVPTLGLRDFGRINSSMAAVTGVDPLTNDVALTFSELTQQLPGGYDLRAFGTSQQVGIAKLALEYCDALVDDPVRRDVFFGTSPPFAFDQPVATAFASQLDKDVITSALVNEMSGSGISLQPDPLAAQALLGALIDDLNASCGSIVCDATRTRTVVKATCAAMLSSAAMTIH